MKKYYKLCKIYPNSDELNTIYCLNERKNVLKLITKLVNSFSDYSSRVNCYDLKDKEYFEESIGISKDGYVLFRGDYIYNTKDNNNIQYLVSASIKQLENIYHKKENIPVAKGLPEKWEDLKITIKIKFENVK